MLSELNTISVLLLADNPRSHTLQKPFECDMCKKFFPTNSRSVLPSKNAYWRKTIRMWHFMTHVTFETFFSSVNKIFCQKSHLNYHRKVILERNFSNATHTLKQSVGNLTYLHIKEFSPEKNLSSVLHVRKHLIKNPTNLIIKEFILENNFVLLQILVINTWLLPLIVVFISFIYSIFFFFLCSVSL